MAFTYLILNLAFMACIMFLLVKSVHAPTKTWWITLGTLLALTLVFDNLAIWAGIFSYSPEKILGLHIGLAPIEDFFYAVFAVVLIPVLWKRFERVSETKKESRHGNA